MLQMAMAAARRGGLRSAYPEHAYQGYELEADEVQAAPPSALVSQPRRGTAELPAAMMLGPPRRAAHIKNENEVLYLCASASRDGP